MRINIKDFLRNCGLEENIYPGKRVVKKLPQTGENKSHSAVFDWRIPGILRLDIKAGLSGKDLPKKDLAKFPVSFHMPTYLEIATSDSLFSQTAIQGANDDHHDEEEGEGESSSGSRGGGGGKGLRKTRTAFHAFSQVMEGKIPDAGDIKKMVVMGKEIAKEAFASILSILEAQIKAMTVAPVNILAAAHAVKVTVVTPGGGLAPKGNEDIAYKYKARDMFGLD